MKVREKIASQIDADPPAHALARLVASLDRIDLSIRAIDAAAAQRTEQEKQGGGPVADAPFRSSAL
jgi:hypothetical protein